MEIDVSHYFKSFMEDFVTFAAVFMLGFMCAHMPSRKKNTVKEKEGDTIFSPGED